MGVRFRGGKQEMFTFFKRLGRAVLGACALSLALTQPANALRVSPMVAEMEVSGGGSVARIEVQNINAGRLAFETRVYRINIDENGVTTEIAADDDFLIFPPQGVLPPGGRQVVRLQWVGEGDIPTSQAYYVSVEQLPVAFDQVEEGELAAKVQVLYNLRALVVVSPPGATPDVSAETVVAANYQLPPEPGSEAEPATISGVRVTLKNEGRRHAMMSNFGWKLVGKDPEGNFLRVDLSPQELSQVVGTGYVPALGKRTFDLPIPGFGDQPIELTFKR